MTFPAVVILASALVHAACVVAMWRLSRSIERSREQCIASLRRAEAAEQRMLALVFGGPVTRSRAERAMQDVIAIYHGRRPDV